MRRFDKKYKIEKANLLSEQRYLQSKGLVNEMVSGAQKTDSDIDDLAGEIIKNSKGDEAKENELIVKTAAGDEEIQRRLTNRISKIKNS
jgi:hypothetical protein